MSISIEWEAMEGFSWGAPTILDGVEVEIVGPAEAAKLFRQKIKVAGKTYYLHFTLKGKTVVFYETEEVDG